MGSGVTKNVQTVGRIESDGLNHRTSRDGAVEVTQLPFNPDRYHGGVREHLITGGIRRNGYRRVRISHQVLLTVSG
jgi:hypothetical protein